MTEKFTGGVEGLGSVNIGNTAPPHLWYMADTTEYGGDSVVVHEVARQISDDVVGAVIDGKHAREHAESAVHYMQQAADSRKRADQSTVLKNESLEKIYDDIDRANHPWHIAVALKLGAAYTVQQNENTEGVNTRAIDVEADIASFAEEIAPTLKDLYKKYTNAFFYRTEYFKNEDGINIRTLMVDLCSDITTAIRSEKNKLSISLTFNTVTGKNLDKVEILLPFSDNNEPELQHAQIAADTIEHEVYTTSMRTICNQRDAATVLGLHDAYSPELLIALDAQGLMPDLTNLTVDVSMLLAHESILMQMAFDIVARHLREGIETGDRDWENKLPNWIPKSAVAYCKQQVAAEQEMRIADADQVLNFLNRAPE